jgi:hypothetical protein
MRHIDLKNGHDSGAGMVPLEAPLMSTITGSKTLLRSLGQLPPLGRIFSLSDHDNRVGLAEVSRVFKIDETETPINIHSLAAC